MKSKSCIFKNCLTTAVPNVNDTPYYITLVNTYVEFYWEVNNIQSNLVNSKLKGPKKLCKDDK